MTNLRPGIRFFVKIRGRFGQKQQNHKIHENQGNSFQFTNTLHAGYAKLTSLGYNQENF